MIRARVACDCTFGAVLRTSEVPDGHYFPAINVYSRQTSVDFPSQVDITAAVSDVSNLGTVRIDTVVTILCAIDFGWVAQRRHAMVNFTASGSQGLRRN
ncbi:hypothetical protein [uncultured Piscinibacter sp.]|uniref:hypothetical protein n=1 Tax=uncultured Piscinibacter sp. TaxID=1131835 RepID=UPI0026311F8A|nr:hypothetical protein [uncultured Piscinibacter sp.]